MAKSPDAFRTISEVADWLGIQAHVLRFWESKFTQVKPIKRAGGRRYYRPADMLLLGGIKRLLHDDGLTIKGVQKILREEGMNHVSSLSPVLDDAAATDAAPQATAPEAPLSVVEPVEEKGVVLDFGARAAEDTKEAEVDAPAPVETAIVSGDPLPVSTEESTAPEDEAPAAVDTMISDTPAAAAEELPEAIDPEPLPIEAAEEASDPIGEAEPPIEPAPTLVAEQAPEPAAETQPAAPVDPAVPAQEQQADVAHTPEQVDVVAEDSAPEETPPSIPQTAAPIEEDASAQMSDTAPEVQESIAEPAEAPSAPAEVTSAPSTHTEEPQDDTPPEAAEEPAPVNALPAFLRRPLNEPTLDVTPDPPAESSPSADTTSEPVSKPEPDVEAGPESPVETVSEPVSPPAPKPRNIEMPAFTAEAEIAASPAVLAGAYRARKLTGEAASKATPLLAQLATLRDQMAARRRNPPGAGAKD